MRNCRCPSYGRCLDRTIADGRADFDCTGCCRRFDEDAITDLEVARCVVLAAVVLGHARFDPGAIDITELLTTTRPGAGFHLTGDEDPWQGEGA